MNGERKSCVERILSAIEFGKLPSDETERRLCELVEAEVNKTDSEADMELIKTCQSLLWQFHTHGDNPYDSHYNANKAKIDQRIRRKALIANKAKAVGKMLTAAAAVILLFVGVRFSWFEHSDTPDGQQHVITGQEVTVEMVQEAIAENAGRGSFGTTDLQELQRVIGFNPQIPDTIAEQWHISACSVLFLRNSIQVTVTYARTEVSDGYVSYVIGYYSDVGDAHTTLEQSNVGKVTTISGVKVYIASNIDNQVACWNIENVVYELSAEMNERDFMNMLKIFVEGDNE